MRWIGAFGVGVRRDVGMGILVWKGKGGDGWEI